jgi:hypothetical protein
MMMGNMNRSLQTIALGAVVSAMVTAAGAQTFYLGTGATGTQTLYTMNYSGSGAPPTPTSVGALGISSAYGGPTWDPANSTMYFVNGASTDPSKLYTLNLTTGAATFLANTSVPLIDELAYDSQNGNFYGFCGENVAGGPTMGLYLVSTNGASTLINNNTTQISALTYNPVLNELIGAVPNGGLYEIDPTTGDLTELAATSGAKDTAWLVYDPISGDYYGDDNSRNFWEINSSTYAVTSLSTSLTTFRPNGLAEITPEPGVLALAATGLLTLGGFTWRRRL